MKQRGSGPRRLPASAWVFDSALALVAAGWPMAFFASMPVPSGVPVGMLALGYALVLLHTLPLAARRRFPGTVLGICVASGLAITGLGLPVLFLGPALVAVYSVAAYGDRWVSLAGLAAAELGLAAVQLTPGRFEEPVVSVQFALIVGAAWLLGYFVGDRYVYAARLEERTAELEQAREELARRAVAEERLRLARELHDVVAHSMSVIAVQSGVGAHVAESRPEEVGKALAAIEATSRAALEELRRLLGVLRQDSEPQASLSPVPGLADLEGLLGEVAKAGLAVRLRVEGTPSPLPAGVDLSAYRIVQEALTNVVKHAGPAQAQVTIGYRDRDVTVEVTDDGRGAAAPAGDGRGGTGHGLVGMRERVAAFGGDLEAGPCPGGGFRVAARLPLAADADEYPGGSHRRPHPGPGPGRVPAVGRLRPELAPDYWSSQTERAVGHRRAYIRGRRRGDLWCTGGCRLGVDVAAARWRWRQPMNEGARWLRRLRASPWVFDSGLALVAVGVSTVFFVGNPAARGLPRGTLAVGYALVLLHTLPLAARRRFPGAVLALCAASGLAITALGLPPETLGVAIWVAVYSVAAYGDRWVSLAGLAAAELGSAAVQLTPGRFQAPTVVGNGLIIGTAWLLGHFAGVRRGYITRLEERTAELEQARAELARRAVTEERLRLARELHDVVAHSISMIAVQSGVGAHVADTQPEEAAKALAAIEATSRAALTELRRLLGVLRQDSEPQASLSPVPGLADLESLLGEVAKAGLAVKLQVHGTRPPLPAGVDLSAYRIVQEALTNVVKHAGPARAQVVIGYHDQDVTVEILDDGRGAATSTGEGRAGTGHGLIGMRERVAAFGGDLEAGPGPDGGFRVAARLPLAVEGR